MSLSMGFYLDRLALFEGVELAVLQQQITLWHSGEDVKAGLLQVEPGSAVLIDEVQTVFRSKDKTDPAALAVARNPSAQGHRPGADVSTVWASHPRGESVGGSDHEVSPAGSVRVEESVSGLRERATLKSWK